MRYIILLFALTLSIAKASAQDVLNEVLRTSDAIINDTTKSMDERRTALFKFDAMTYMRSKILPPYVMLDKNLSKDTFHVCNCHPEKRRYPHPEQGPRAPHCNSTRYAQDISRSYTHS